MEKGMKKIIGQGQKRVEELEKSGDGRRVVQNRIAVAAQTIRSKRYAIVMCMAVFIFCGTGITLNAATITAPPNSFNSGTTISSSAVNSNFSTLWANDQAMNSQLFWSVVTGGINFSGGNIGIGCTPGWQGHIKGLGQATAAIADAGNKGGTLLISDSGTGPGNGGCLLFGDTYSGDNKFFAAIKGLVYDGTSNTTGDLAFSTRLLVGDAALTERMRITRTGNVGIGTGTSTPSNLLTMETSGGGYYSASDHQWHNGSSVRIKQDVAPNKMDVLGILDGLEVFNYRYRSEVETDPAAPYHIGFVAEEAPELLTGKGRDSMAIGDCIGFLLGVVKEQQKTIDSLSARLEALEKGR